MSVVPGRRLRVLAERGEQVADQHRPGPDRTRGDQLIAVASNQAFPGWTDTFTDPRLCAAIIDRLTFAGLIIETGTASYRLAHAKAQRAAAS